MGRGGREQATPRDQQAADDDRGGEEGGGDDDVTQYPQDQQRRRDACRAGDQRRAARRRQAIDRGEGTRGHRVLHGSALESVKRRDRKSVVWGKSVSVRVTFGGRRSIKKQNN